MRNKVLHQKSGKDSVRKIKIMDGFKQTTRRKLLTNKIDTVRSIIVDTLKYKLALLCCYSFLFYFPRIKRVILNCTKCTAIQERFNIMVEISQF